MNVYGAFQLDICFKVNRLYKCPKHIDNVNFLGRSRSRSSKGGKGKTIKTGSRSRSRLKI